MKRETRQKRLSRSLLSFLGLLAVSTAVTVVAAADTDRSARVAEPVRAPARPTATRPASQPAGGQRPGLVPDPKQTGGEAESIVQVANLVYAGTKSSKCFSDHFLVKAEKESAISTSRRFHAVKLGSDELFGFPMVIMTGEGTFVLRDEERRNLKQFADGGGFLLASAGCSSQEWDRSFRAEMARIFPEQAMSPIGMDHPVFHTVYDIKSLRTKHGQPHPLEGIHIGGRLAILYSQDGLNDTGHTQGCCCCGGNELVNAIDINVNVLAYALVY